MLLSTGFVGQVIGVWDVSQKREDDYIKKYVESQVEIAEIRRTMDVLTTRLMTLELASAEIPFPYWIKDRSSVILYINNEYRDKILAPLGITKAQFINTKGENISNEFADEIAVNDKLVMASKKVMLFKENVPTLGNGTSYKFPLYNNFGIVIGTAGLWIPENPQF